MKDGELCRLTLTVIGRLVDAQLEWETVIETHATQKHMAPGLDLRDYEPELCRVGCESLECYEGQAEDDWRIRHGVG